MRSRATALGLAVAVAAVAGALILHSKRSIRRSPPALLIYNGSSGDASLVDDVRTAARRRTLPCVSFGRFAQRVAVHGRELVALDTVARAIARLSLDELDQVARGERRCEAEHNLVRSTPVARGHIPYRGQFAGERLFVSYFSDNHVEQYQWNASGPRFIRDISFSFGENLGLSEMAVLGDTLLVTAAGYHCFLRECPAGRFHDPHLFFVEISHPDPPFAEVRPAELNTCGIRTLGDQAWIVNAGDLAGGRSSLQRLDAKRQLGPQIRLPSAAGAVSVHALSPTTLAVLQMSGEHLFLIDSAAGTLTRILRFDGQSLRELPLTTEAVAERSQANFQDLIADSKQADRFYLIDEKGERLLHLRFHAQDRTLQLIGVTKLATEAYHAGPTWGVFLDADQAGKL